MIKVARVFIKICLLLLILAAILSFTIGNQQIISLSLPPTDINVRIPLFGIMVLMFLAGVLAAIASATLHYRAKIRRYKKDNHRLSKEVTALEAEIKTSQTEKYAKTQVQHHIEQLEHAGNA